MASSYRVEIRQSVYGKGLFATEDIEAYEVALTVHRSKFIVYDDLLLRWPDCVSPLGKDKRVSFAYALACQFQNSQASPYREYLLSMPLFVDCPIRLQEAELKQFQDPKMVERLVQKRRRILEEYDFLLHKASQKFSLPEFLHCYSLIESRTLYFPTLKDPRSEVGAMVPFYDMCNHAEQVNEHNIYKLFYFDKDINSYCLRAYQQFKKGEQLFISYGSYNNQHFAQYYGFIPTANRNVLTLQLDATLPADKYLTLRLQLISMVLPELLDHKKKGLKQPVIISFNESGELLESSLLYILFLTAQSLSTQSKKQLFASITDAENLSSICDIPKLNEFVRSAAQSSLQKYPTTLEQDIQLRADLPSNSSHIALDYRIAEKRQLGLMTTFSIQIQQ